MNNFKGNIVEDCVLCDEEIIKYQYALAEVKMYLDAMLKYFFENKSENFVTSWRFKENESIQGKIKRKKKEKGSNFDLRKDITDISGIRVVISDESDYYNNLSHGLHYMDSQIHLWSNYEFKQNFDDIVDKYDGNYISVINDFIEFLVSDSRYSGRVVVTDGKNYIKHPKKSGYQSLHILVYAMNGYPVEIQFRNLAQHYFAEFEHENRYKNNRSISSECDKIFSECGTKLESISTQYYSKKSDYKCFDDNRLRLSLI